MGAILRWAPADQRMLGWNHALKGSLSPHWWAAQQRYYSERYQDDKTLGGQRWAVQLMRGLWWLYKGKGNTQSNKLHSRGGPQWDGFLRKVRFYYGNPRAYVGTADLPLFYRPRDELPKQSETTISL